MSRMTLRARFLLPVALVAALAAAPGAAAAPGDLDSSFGSGGVAQGPPGSAFGRDAVGPDGRLYAAGTQSGGRATVTRFSSSGGLELTVTAPALGVAPTSLGNAVAVQGDGKMLVAGAVTDDGTPFGMLVLRFNADGSIDGSFGQGGGALALQGLGSEALDIALQPDGKVVLAGTARSGDDRYPRVALARFNSDGSPDASFAAGGTAIHDLGRNSYARGLALQPDGRLLVAGSSRHDLRVTNAFVARFTPTGGLETSYTHQYAIGGAFSAFRDVAVQPDGAVVATGTTLERTPSGTLVHTLLARFTSGFSPDSSFGGSGQVLIPSGAYGNDPDNAPGGRAVVIAGGGDIVAAGKQQDNPGAAPRLGVWAVTPGGVLDPGFGVGGRAFAPASDAQGLGLAIQPNGDLVASALQGTAGGLLARFIGLGPPPVAPPGGGGGGGGNGGGGNGGGGGGSETPVAKLDPANPHVSISLGKHAKVSVGRSGTLVLRVINRNAFLVNGSLKIRSSAKVRTSRKRTVTFASKRFSVAAKGSKRVKLRLSKRNRALLRRLRRVKVTLTLSLTDRNGGRASVKRRHTLVAGRSLLRRSR